MTSSVTGKRSDEDVMLAAQADTEAWYGRLKNSRELIRRAMDLTERNDARDAAGYQVAIAFFRVDSGNRAQGHHRCRRVAMKLAPNREVQEIAAGGIGRRWAIRQQQRSWRANSTRVFRWTPLVQRYWLPCDGAGDRDHGARTRTGPSEFLRVVERPNWSEQACCRLICVEKRISCFMMATGQQLSFQKFIDHHGVVRNEPVGRTGPAGAGANLAMQDDTTKARAAYQDFLTIWKDADPDLPILKQAKAEYAKLQ